MISYKDGPEEHRKSLNVFNPLFMRLSFITRETQEFDTPAVELLRILGDLSELGGAHGGEVT